MNAILVDAPLTDAKRRELGVADEIVRLSQCHVFAVQPTQSFSGL